MKSKREGKNLSPIQHFYLLGDFSMKVADWTIEEFEDLLRKTIEDEIEDLYIMLDPTTKAKIEEGIRDTREGRVISPNDLVARRKTKRGEV